MQRLSESSLTRSTVMGLGVGAVLGSMLAWALLVANPVVSHLVANDPTPLSTFFTLGGAMAALFAVGAALSAIVINLLCNDP